MSNNDQRYDDLRVQIIIDSNCNLACDYCVLLYKNQNYKDERAITYQVLDKYIEFYITNYELILKYYRKITITFFGGEPLLSKDKLAYIVKKLIHLEKINFVVHTNGVLMNKKVLAPFLEFDRNKFTFIVSIDGQLEVMMKYRLKNKVEHYMILRGIKYLKEYGFTYLFSPSIMKPKAIDLFKDYVYLYSKQPHGMIINPITAIYRVREKETDKEIVKGVKMFLDYLRHKEKLTDREIIDFLGLPLLLSDYKDFLKFGLNLTGDIDGTVHAMSFAWQGFDDGTTYCREDLEDITLGNVIFNKDLLIENICRKDLYNDENIWRVAYDQQRRRTLPDWDVQNMLAAMILNYFRDFYKTGLKRRYVS